jgi:diguanylate cyclase (GGDEF)-like protein/PAS domain S-box-containing protein
VISDEVEVEINCLNGEQKIVSLSASQYVDAVGSELLISVYDITARKAVEEQLRFSSNIFEQTHEGILLTDIDSKVIDVNPAFTKITGYSREEIIGQTANILNSGQHSTSFFKQLWQELLDTGQWQGEVWNKTKAGEIFPERLAITAIVDDEGDITHYVGMFSDITHMKAQQEKLELMAHYDVLTKLPNRVLLADRFSQAVAHSKRTDTMLAVCFLDLDGFKEVNDNYGHEIGDNLLIEVAKRLKEQLRGEDTLSRFGGDEFAIILRDIDNLDECEQLLHRVHDAVAEAYTIDGLTLNVSASTGFTMYPNDSSELDVLLRHADQAMYDAKLLGRNQFKQFDSDISVKTQAKQEAITRFQQAIADDELRLFFQPKVNMRTGVVYGMEALIRWQHPEKGLLPPGLFLPEVEGTHVEIALGNWVLKNAMRELNCWHRQGHQLEVSVNIDSIHLLSGDVISDVERVLADYPEISASFLQLEILETSDLGDIKVISTIIQSMKNALGVQVALDDFGTGYSSLAHLRHLFGTTIKIDQSFVRNMLDDPHDYSIVDGVIGLANSFNRQVIAEGVETVDHGIILEMMGCQLAQGYGIAKPMPAHEVVPWLQQYQQDKAWTHFGNQTFTPVQKSLIQFRILSQRWYDIFAKTIQNEETTSPNIWPKMDSSKCQCGKWIKVNRAKGLFSSKWFVELQQLHKKFHTIAYQIRESYITEDSIQAQKELDKLHDVLVDIQRHLPSEHHIR